MYCLRTARLIQRSGETEGSNGKIFLTGEARRQDAHLHIIQSRYVAGIRNVSCILHTGVNVTKKGISVNNL